MEEIPFEKAMDRLEEIVDLMSQPTTSLDTSLQLYEEAESLMRICESRIRQAEERVRQLSEKRKEDFPSLEEVPYTH